ncbi:Ganglioside GM2 activator [Amphibalanus amphitrite]|uniref:Ganglioside GM2 activator n=1 Tax=Amphibalanus amphitrite TaxID=1232801 RepID=A0A6A4VV00_AMPAM|nr:ganglioside GM2 activator-like [Amphibalanus amphitrite]KAF0297483.1 Ganglioside GM2 activator [Amphibalanus amphitrite]
MRTLAVLAVLVSLAAANTIQDCGLTPNAVFHDASVTPDPVIVPGPMTLKFQGDLTADWPADMMIMVEVIKEDPFDIEVPCLNGLGSCEVDMCAYITQYPEAFCPLFPPEVPCSCSLLAGHYQSDGFTLTLPDLGEGIDSVIAGGYHGNVTLYSKSAPETLLGCVRFDFQLEYVPPS